MASVLHLPASEGAPPSLDLDLSLGSLFSKHNVSPPEALASCLTDGDEGACTAAPPSTDTRIYDADNNACAAWSNNASLSPVLSSPNEPPALPKSKGLQAQRWHATRKRRKYITEEKLHRRFKGENLSRDAHMSRPPNCAHIFDWGGPEGNAEQKLLDGNVLSVNPERVNTSKSIVKNHDMFFYPLGHGMSSAVEPGMPSSVERGMPWHGMQSGLVHDVSWSIQHGMDGDVSFPSQSVTSRMSCRHIQTTSSRATCCGSSTAEDQCTSNACKQMTSCTPCVNVQKDRCVSSWGDHVPCAVGIPTCASSTSLYAAASLIDKREKMTDDDDKQKTCMSNSSGSENDCVRDMQNKIDAIAHDSVDRKNGVHMQTHARAFEEKLDRPFADLRRVMTRGSGPHGKTIYGVMYLTKGKQAWLICSCHRKCMSPAEFVEHSGSNDLSNPERSILLISWPPIKHILAAPL